MTDLLIKLEEDNKQLLQLLLDRLPRRRICTYCAKFGHQPGRSACRVFVANLYDRVHWNELAVCESDLMILDELLDSMKVQELVDLGVAVSRGSRKHSCY
jgi:hypothetical protein